MPSHTHDVYNESASGPQWIAFSSPNVNPPAPSGGDSSTGQNPDGSLNDRKFVIVAKGGGQPHNHTFAGSYMPFNVQYINLIIARKN
jgi:hypothetical protein